MLEDSGRCPMVLFILGLLLLFLKHQENLHTPTKKPTKMYIYKNIKVTVYFMTGRCNFHLLIYKLLWSACETV